jgi:hypothetical protein
MITTWRRYLATAGFVPFAGDLSLLFPVDIRNASVYAKAAAAVEERNLVQAEEALGAAGLWACAAEMHRVHGSQEDFARVSSAHAPHLLKVASAKSSKLQHEQPSHKPSGPGQSDRAQPSTESNGVSADTRSFDDVEQQSAAPSTRISFPAPPAPARSGLLRARYFIPGAISLSSRA